MNDSNWKKLIDLGKFLPMDAASVLIQVAVEFVGPQWPNGEQPKGEHSPKGKMLLKGLLAAMLSVAAFESLKICLDLTEKEIEGSAHKGQATWLSNGLKIQEMQYKFQQLSKLSLQALVRKIGSHPMPDQQRDIALKCAWLQERVVEFQKQAANILQASPNSGDDSWDNTPLRETYISIGGGEDDDECTSSAEEPNQLQVSGNHSTDSSIDAEYIPLHLPSHLGCDWCDENGAKDVAMVDLGASSSLLDRYKVLRHKDLSVKTSIIAPHMCGQWNKTLPWFWTMNIWRDADVGEWMEDFYRQELIEPESWPGHAVWAARQSMMWGSMAIQAGSKFTTLLNSDPPPKFAKPPAIMSHQQVSEAVAANDLGLAHG
ncbi:hypothetical protein EDB89DRAFT_1906381 [Lactarius sanguifluus]|nr:hypothetical protein EDB89DRAFT_1906381 [Lactarius sanguifluus]